MNKSGTHVFDEKIIDNSIYLLLVIGERRDSGGGNINIYQLREKALSCCVPFLVSDCCSSFSVNQLGARKLIQGQEILDVLVPDKEIEFHSQPHRVYLASETGYLTKELFKPVMEEFTK